MTRGEASLAMAIRTEKIGYNSFLAMKRVPGITAECQFCQHPVQNAKHIIVYCPHFEENRWAEDSLFHRA